MIAGSGTSKPSTGLDLRRTSNHHRDVPFGDLARFATSWSRRPGTKTWAAGMWFAPRARGLSLDGWNVEDRGTKKSTSIPRGYLFFFPLPTSDPQFFSVEPEKRRCADEYTSIPPPPTSPAACTAPRISRIHQCEAHRV